MIKKTLNTLVMTIITALSENGYAMQGVRGVAPLFCQQAARLHVTPGAESAHRLATKLLDERALEWVAPQYAEQKKEIAFRTAMSHPVNPHARAFSSLNNHPLLSTDDLSTHLYLPLPALEDAFLMSVNNLTRFSPIQTLEFTFDESYTAWKVPYACHDHVSRHRVCSLPFSPHPSAFETADLIYAQYVENAMNPLEHIAFFDTIAALLKRGGHAFLAARSGVWFKESMEDPIFRYYAAFQKNEIPYAGFMRLRGHRDETFIGPRFLDLSLKVSEVKRPGDTVLIQTVKDKDEARLLKKKGMTIQHQEIVHVVNQFTPEVYVSAVFLNPDLRLSIKETGYINERGEKHSRWTSPHSCAYMILRKE